MAVSTQSALRSSLNPNAPIFVPSAFKQVEDFSPQWWELVQTTAWFRDYWFQETQQQQEFDAFYDEEEEDIENLLPDSIDLDIANDMYLFEAEAAAAAENEMLYGACKAENMKLGYVNDAEAVLRSLNMNSPRNGVKSFVPARYPEKPAQRMSPKGANRRNIHQPR